MKNISYILQFIDSAKSMANSFLDLVNNLSEGIHEIKCKFGHDDKTCRIKYCNCFLKYTNFKDDLTEYKCLCCNKKYQHEFHKGTIF